MHRTVILYLASILGSRRMPPLYLPEQMNYHSPIKLRGEKLARKTFMQCNISAIKFRYSYSYSKYTEAAAKCLCSSLEMMLFELPAFQWNFIKDFSLIPNEVTLMDDSLSSTAYLVTFTNYHSVISRLFNTVININAVTQNTFVKEQLILFSQKD